MDRVCAKIMQFLATLMVLIFLATAIFVSTQEAREEDERAEEFHQLYQAHLEKTKGE